MPFETSQAFRHQDLSGVSSFSLQPVFDLFPPEGAIRALAVDEVVFLILTLDHILSFFP